MQLAIVAVQTIRTAFACRRGVQEGDVTLLEAASRQTDEMLERRLLAMDSYTGRGGGKLQLH
jgi:succinate dehydrogenase flavin-adding protein (antitoxin of CptAB toxin-antitoxin module)